MNIYKRLFAIAALCSMLATTISEALANKGYLTIGLNDEFSDSNYVSYTIVAGTPTKAKGFDISMACYIATTLGLRAKFVAYANDDALRAALTAGKIDCYNDQLSTVVADVEGRAQVDFYGVATFINPENYITPTAAAPFVANVQNVAYGLVFAPITATGDNLPCKLMQQVELAVNLAVSSGAFACFASRNNANVDGAEVLVGVLTAPTPFFSTISGTIPANTFNQGTVTTNCNSCTRNQLPVTSCLVNYLLINKDECNSIVDTTNLS